MSILRKRKEEWVDNYHSHYGFLYIFKGLLYCPIGKCQLDSSLGSLWHLFFLPWKIMKLYTPDGGRSELQSCQQKKHQKKKCDLFLWLQARLYGAWHVSGAVFSAGNSQQLVLLESVHMNIWRLAQTNQLRFQHTRKKISPLGLNIDI